MAGRSEYWTGTRASRRSWKAPVPRSWNPLDLDQGGTGAGEWARAYENMGDKRMETTRGVSLSDVQAV